MYQIISSAYKDVDLILEDRLQSGLIKDKKQANKTVVGNTFAFTVIYVFLHNKIVGNIRSNIFITSELSTIPEFNQISVINIGGGKLKNQIVIWSFILLKKKIN